MNLPCAVQVEYSDMSVMSWNLTGLDLICGMKNHTNSTHVIHGVQVSGIDFFMLLYYQNAPFFHGSF
jgi:hypothetical protein